MKTSGFTYIEVLVATAIFVIMMVPVLSALTQARLNHNYAVSRRIAQSHAVALSLKVRAAPHEAADIVSRMTDDDDRFEYRVSLIPVGGAGFSTEFGDLFEGGTFVVAEVFDSSGILAGMSVSKTTGQNF